MLTNQAYLFLIFTVNGIIIGLLFDFFRILRKTIKTKDIVTYIEDFIFWFLTGAIILYSIFTFNNGEVRFYMFLAILMGVITYLLFVSKYVIEINVTIITFLKKAIKKIFYIVSIPFVFIFKMIKKVLMKPVLFCIINIRNNFTKLGKKVFHFFKKDKNYVKN